MKDGQEGFRTRIAVWMHGAGDEVVREAMELGMKQVATYDAFIGRVEAKATGILSSAGLCVTLAAAFGSWPIPGSSRDGFLSWALALSFLVTIGLGIAAGVLAAQALRVSRHATIDELVVFSDELQTVDQKTYCNALAQQAWSVVKILEGVVERKAALLVWSQTLFVAFMLGVAVFAALAVIATRLGGA